MKVRRIVISVIGFSVVFLGILLLVLPGPGIIVIAIGVAVLALEYEWANKLFENIKKLIEKLFKK